MRASDKAWSAGSFPQEEGSLVSENEDDRDADGKSRRNQSFPKAP